MPHHSSDHMSYSEALQRLKKSERPYGNALSSEARLPSDSWDLNTGFKKAKKLARDGWDEPRIEILSYLSQVEAVYLSNNETHYDVSGECVDIGRFLEGEPECMLNTQIPKWRDFRIVVNVSVCFDVESQLIKNRGIGVAALVYSLQASGAGVSLQLASLVECGRHKHSTNIEIIRHDDYLDCGRLAFWLAHPAAFRRCIFRYNEQQPDAVRDKIGFYMERGYGRPIELDIEEDPNIPTVHVPLFSEEEQSYCKTPDDAYRRLREIARAQGITLLDSS